MMTYSTTPSAEQLRELSTAELGLILLKNLESQISIHNRFKAHKQGHDQNQEPDVDYLLGRLSDAWAWLVAEGCVGPDPSDVSRFHRVTERGRCLRKEGTVSNVSAD